MAAAFPGYAWRILTNVVEVAVVLFAFSRLHDDFQIIVMAVLGTIYVAVRGVGLGLTVCYAKLQATLDEEFPRLRHILNDSQLNHSHDIARRGEGKTRTHSRIVVHSVINSYGMVAVSLICMYEFFVNIVHL
jgi:hypothetical protein